MSSATSSATAATTTPRIGANEIVRVEQDEILTGEAVTLDVQPAGFFLRTAGAAIDLLVEEGNVSVVDGPRNSRLHTLERPYSQREDPRSDLYRPSGDSRDAEAPVTVSVSYRGRRETDTQPSPGDGRETVGDGHTLEAVR